MSSPAHVTLRLCMLDLLLGLTLGLAGCLSAGLHSKEPPQQQYLLSWPAPTGDTAGLAAPTAAVSASLDAARSLQVLVPTTAPGLAGDGIALLRPAGQLDYYSGARWGASAPQMLQTLAIQALRQRGRFSLVQSDSAAFEAGWVLQLELTHFEADYAGDAAPTIRVAMVGTLGQRSDRRAVLTLSLQTSAQATANRMSAVVAAFQAASTEALRQLADRVQPPAATAP